MEPEHTNVGTNGVVVDAADAAEVERLLAEYEHSDYVEAVVEIAEQSERNYQAALMAGRVVNGFSDSTNY